MGDPPSVFFLGAARTPRPVVTSSAGPPDQCCVHAKEQATSEINFQNIHHLTRYIYMLQFQQVINIQHHE